MKFILQFVLILATSAFCKSQSTTEYFRHLRYNHISPYAEITGIYSIDKSIAKLASHYVFKYDQNGRLSEVINNHYHTEKKHPLASLGVYKVVIEIKSDQEIRTFFDPNGKRISNDKEVYKEIYFLDKNQQKIKLQFFDLNDLPMESNWGIAEYQWTHQKDFIIEKRYNLTGKMVNVSPYFDFGITGIEVNKNGLPIGHYNLNDHLKITNNATGVASYRDNFDSEGNHKKYSYYNANNELTLNQWQFAYGVKSYDEFGNNILLEQYDTQNKLTRSRHVYTNSKITLGLIASVEDSIEIKTQSLGYLIALQQLDPILMNDVMSDSLNKVTIGFNRELKKAIPRATTRNQMIAFAEDWNKSNMKFPHIPNNQVEILGIYDQIASVKLTSDNWVEYLHLMKLDGKWKIVNLIWQHKDVSRYRNN